MPYSRNTDLTMHSIYAFLHNPYPRLMAFNREHFQNVLQVKEIFDAIFFKLPLIKN